MSNSQEAAPRWARNYFPRAFPRIAPSTLTKPKPRPVLNNGCGKVSGGGGGVPPEPLPRGRGQLQAVVSRRVYRPPLDLAHRPNRDVSRPVKHRSGSGPGLLESGNGNSGFFRRSKWTCKLRNYIKLTQKSKVKRYRLV